ncbi:thiamine pyrophosphokinase [Collinsella sp. An2]|uniref:thiamine pyrophosphokinase n=1 Tax=Collinsella sp. An2 TaxID=1965585 RepID=UPI001EF750E9|nr:thiamine pyrophosphokinase [Collinsella sp. An2]
MDAATRILVVGGSPEPSSAETIRCAAAGCKAVVAVDRGLDALLAAGVSCDLFCGDADSVSEHGAELVRLCERDVSGNAAGAADAPRFEVVRYNPHKDDTDLGLALGEIACRWPGASLVGTCLSGGHPDHALAVLGRLSTWDGGVEVIEDGFVQRILKRGDAWELHGHTGARFTFVPLSLSATVSERKMRWNLDHKRVSLLSDLGVSNVVEAESASITCHEGIISAWVFER